ncbi:MAG: hypothetical protein IPJ40_09110 [Saprospirales bacterium]|nr:hypothetical protein [Saprospirales bacterium]
MAKCRQFPSKPANEAQTSFPEPRQTDSTTPPLCMAHLSIAWLTTMDDSAFSYQALLGSDWKTSLLKPPILEG